MNDFSNYMTPPTEPNVEAYIEEKWICCPWCGKKQFPTEEETMIENLQWICKNNRCKKEFKINIVKEVL